MNENPRILVAFCLEKYSITNCANMLDQMLANMVARFASALIKKSLHAENSTKNIYIYVLFKKKWTRALTLNTKSTLRVLRSIYLDMAMKDICNILT